MPESRKTSGKCDICGHSTTKGAMAGHLDKCLPAHDTRGTSTKMVELRFESPGDPRYWLFVEAKAGSALDDIDALLRRVWLECCGHMSAFYVGHGELDKGAKIGTVLSTKGLKFKYDYDFGSTTRLGGQVVGTRVGAAGDAPVRLLARNEPPAWSCDECDAPATTLCQYCFEEDGGLFCDTHADEHPHAEEEVYLPVVNSPRMGVCGYAG